MSQLLTFGIDSGSLNRFLTLRHFRFGFRQLRIDSAKVQNQFSSGLSESTRFVKNRFVRVRKVLATMSRRKTPAVKLTSAPPKVPTPLSQVPLRRWFTNKDNWEEFQRFFSKMILKPRYLSEGLLPEDKHPEFWELLDFQGLRPLLFA
ncbi:hypothetical protein PIB30_073662 [Stylosanthes scabra]|uniref:Uncharacterized protein n=1 Tax=Stylosanthes scabra TaxID=79078 RepID=A0ABU6XQ61_9FABA|nr:hypothetical protein [Stylosanthes scabra]